MITTENKLSSREIQFASAHLDQTANAMAAEIAGLSDGQLQFRPAEGRWSILENLEHCVIIQDLVLTRISDQLAVAPSGANPDAAEIDRIAVELMPVRAEKFQAPPFVFPTGQVPVADALGRLRANTEALKRRLEDAAGLREHSIPSPPLKAVSGGRFEQMDGYQWILTAASHTERHRRQIEEVKASTGFPEA